jgi:nucleoside-diphosphate-sugar epimerase
VVGRQLVPQLVESGHEGVGMTSKPEKTDLVADLGATPVVADALDAESVGIAVSEARPDAIVHQMTDLSRGINPRKQAEALKPTNRLRTVGTDHLLSAGMAVGIRRFVAQSFLLGLYERTGAAVKTEQDPVDPDPPSALRGIIAALRYMEAAVTGADWTEGIVLRYGAFYGPGTSLSLDPPGGDMVEAIEQRKLPLIGSGEGVWSFTHVEDAAAATVAALEDGHRGVYNVVDDEPATVSDWLPAMADAVGAKPPRRVPKWLGRLAAGDGFASFMTDARGASNEKAKRELHWFPRHPSWRRELAGGAG